MLAHLIVTLLILAACRVSFSLLEDDDRSNLQKYEENP
jgi:hypothetical protein